MLAKHNIRSVGLATQKISSFLCPVKDSLELRAVGVCGIPCEYGQVYIGQTVRSVDTRLKEHHRHICLGDPNRLEVVEHGFNHLIITIS
jgi:hypothetical protein